EAVAPARLARAKGVTAGGAGGGTAQAADAAGFVAGRPAPWGTAPARRARTPTARLRAVIGAAFAAERERWPLWLPVALGLGIGIYFLLPREPWLWSGPVLAALLLAVTVRLRLRGSVRGAWTAGLVAAVALGFAVAQLRTESMPPPLDPPRRAMVLEGVVQQVDRLPNGRRVVLAQVRLVEAGGAPVAAEAAEPWARTVRVRLRNDDRAANPTPGDRVRIRALIRAPMPPAMPGSFDFQRAAFFQGLGASGFALGPLSVIAPGVPAGSFAQALAFTRHSIVERVQDALPAREAGIAAALLTNVVTSIPPPDMQAMRDAGLAHLLAVSGLNIGIVCGFFLLGLRLLLAAIEPIALRYPIKKWAAVGALIGTYAYMLLAGANVPVQRAFLMAAIVLVGVLFDRAASPMRLLAWAAAAILLVQPEALLGASFQMSFAAVAALVAAWEGLRRLLAARAEHGARHRLLLKAGGLIATSFVASAATMPFAIYHFDRLAAYSVLANAIAVPLTSVWVMPWGV
ncbi:MAG: ComEC family competence protein, partial [Alphaproteobacteria bacterium]|nr:ComEC family competence protein [Alphaproteobacteria bacterium]